MNYKIVSLTTPRVLMPCVELLIHNTIALIYVWLPIINFNYIFTYFLGFDENGVRKLKVVNPNGNHFEPIDPDLVKYLTNRNNIK